jgi:nucleoside-diphosphate-sugar epimerase
LGEDSARKHPAVLQGAIMTSVLVTGAGGFIGRRVVLAASSAGYSVTPIVRKFQLGEVRNVIRHDLRLPLSRLLPVDWIFHLAGAYAGAGYEELRHADLAMAHNVIHWGLAAGIKNWIFASAAEVYGDVHGIASEEAPTQPVIPYGLIKLMVERLLIEKTKDIANSRVVLLRVGEVYGSEGRLITELIARLKRGFCPWPGTGHVPLSFVHVDDAAQAFLSAVESAPAGVSVYNVADDVPTTWQDFLRHVAHLCGSRPPIFLPKPLVQFYALCSTLARRATKREPILTRHAIRLIITPKALSNARLKRDLGFQPRYPTYSEGLEEAVRGVPHHT